MAVAPILPACLDPSAWPDSGPADFREPESAGVVWGERHLQCIWSDSRLRPEIATTDGRRIEVFDPGRWNGGPGPDFLDASLSIGGLEIRGDVEIHVRPSDWAAHGHDSDPAYRNVALHVAWFPPRPGCAVPDVPLALLRDGMLSRPGFSFDCIDPDSYPFGGDTATRRPCRNAFSGAAPETIRAVLEAAGMARAARKSREMLNRAAMSGSPDQFFYEETMAALGWHSNEGPMRRLARIVPAERLASLESDTARWAVLAGCAGLLPREPSRSMPRVFFDEVWRIAFRESAAAPQGGSLNWAAGAGRPANHPRVRLAAAAAMFGTAGALRTALFALPRSDARTWAKAAGKTLVDSAAPGSAIARRWLGKPVRPLGNARANAILANSVVPVLMTEDPGASAMLAAIPGEDVGAAMRETAHRLFGPDHNPALLYSSCALRTQGLLELWRGRCRAAPHECADCPLSQK